MNTDKTAKDESQESGLELVHVGGVGDIVAVVVEGDVVGEELVAEAGEGVDDTEGVVVIEVGEFAAKGEVGEGENGCRVADDVNGELDEGVGGLVAVRGGGWEEGGSSGKVPAGR